jgi:hypothetical protein
MNDTTQIVPLHNLSREAKAQVIDMARGPLRKNFDGFVNIKTRILQTLESNTPAVSGYTATFGRAEEILALFPLDFATCLFIKCYDVYLLQLVNTGIDHAVLTSLKQPLAPAMINFDAVEAYMERASRLVYDKIAFYEVLPPEVRYPYTSYPPVPSLQAFQNHLEDPTNAPVDLRALGVKLPDGADSDSIDWWATSALPNIASVVEPDPLNVGPSTLKPQKK